jgi:hypothetical protein
MSDLTRVPMNVAPDKQGRLWMWIEDCHQLYPSTRSVQWLRHRCPYRCGVSGMVLPESSGHSMKFCSMNHNVTHS